MKKTERCLMHLICWFAIVCAVPLLVSCSSEENAIIGKWTKYILYEGRIIIENDLYYTNEAGESYQTTSSPTWEFFKDGTINIAGDEISIVGNYKFIDKDKIRIDYRAGILDRSFIVTIQSIADDKLSLKIDGKTATFVKVKK
ncbi:MAG: hypothetical protein Q7U10_11345 [Thermodesulfovibrionia bacterium]|nr:hypothetical protein [Thermodesulfovibrionia bacterium]